MRRSGIDRSQSRRFRVDCVDPAQLISLCRLATGLIRFLSLVATLLLWRFVLLGLRL